MGRIDTWNCDECGLEAKGNKPDDWISLASNSILFGDFSESPIDQLYFFCSLKCMNKWLKDVQKRMMEKIKESKRVKEYDVAYNPPIAGTVGDAVANA